MTRLFSWTMRRMPQIMAVVAILFYLGSVITTIAAGQEIRAISEELWPLSVKLRAVVLIFVQPMIPALLLLLGAAILWRWDEFVSSRRDAT